MAGGGTRRRGIIAEINVTPLVDIMLVLLIIFMLTAHLIEKQAIEIELPRANQSSTVEQAVTIMVQVQRDGYIALNGKRIGAVALHDTMAAEVAKNPTKPPQVIVAADKAVSHGRFVWVLDTLKSVGIVSFAIQIDPMELVAPPEP